jgi:hypothetical protein
VWGYHLNISVFGVCELKYRFLPCTIHVEVGAGTIPHLVMSDCMLHALKCGLLLALYHLDRNLLVCCLHIEIFVRKSNIIYKIWQKIEELFFLYEDSGHVVGNKVKTWFNIIKLNFIWSVNSTVHNP